MRWVADGASGVVAPSLARSLSLRPRRLTCPSPRSRQAVWTNTSAWRADSSRQVRVFPSVPCATPSSYCCLLVPLSPCTAWLCSAQGAAAIELTARLRFAPAAPPAPLRCTESPVSVGGEDVAAQLARAQVKLAALTARVASLELKK